MSLRRKRSNSLYIIGKVVQILFIAIILSGLLGAGTAAGYLLGSLKDMPAFDPHYLEPSLTTFIRDINGNIIADLHEEQNRIDVDLEQIPKDLQNAFIAIEDKNFYSHPGIDIKGILRAAYPYLLTGEIHGGGSTITQQLIKNSFLTSRQTIKRKIQEWILAIQMERRYTKEEILEFYLNRIYFGHSAYGIKAAATIYFGKELDELTIAESALLAGLVQAPEVWSPYKNMEGAIYRRNLALDAMVENGYITIQQGEAAKAEPVELAGITRPKHKAPYFVDYVINQVVIELMNEYGITQEKATDMVFNGGLDITTTLDLDMQKAAEEAAREELAEIGEPDDNGIMQPQVAVVIIDPKTGGIRAMVGGRDYGLDYSARLFNRALEPRQPGSSIKPIVDYAPAMDELGWGPATLADDAPFAVKLENKVWDEEKGEYVNELWWPPNYDGQFRGLMSLREALERSRNVPAVRTLVSLPGGVRTGIDYGRALGISSFVLEGRINDLGPSTAIGGLTKGISVLEMTTAYAVFPNQGVYVPHKSILQVKDRDGRVLLGDIRKEKRVVFSPQTAYLMTDVLKGVIETDWGTGRLGRIGRPAAGKTGTTDFTKDAWFVGYTPDLVAGVHIGKDNQDEMDPRWGKIPVLIWKNIMDRVLKDVPVSDFERPRGIVEVEVCSKSGKLPGPNCPEDDIVTELFASGNVPTEECDIHVVAEVCRESGKLATPYCPRSDVVTRLFIKREPYEPYVDSEGQEHYPWDVNLELPDEYCDIHPPSDPEVQQNGGTGDDGTQDPANDNGTNTGNN